MRPKDLIRRLLSKAARDRGGAMIDRSLSRIGFVRWQNAGPVDFQGMDIDPAEAIRRAAGLPCLIDVAPEHMRNVGPEKAVTYFPCKKAAGNPFVETILQYLRTGKIDYADSALKLYHDSFQPTTIAEAFGLADSDDLHFLLSQPPLLTFPPWAQPPLTNYLEHLKQRQKSMEFEGRGEFGKKITYKDGCPQFGPVTEARGALEVERLVNVTDSIMATGYRPKKGYDAVSVVVLRAGERYRFLCRTGHHRTSALTALGYNSIPVSPRPDIVDREEVMQWPGVEKGVFTPSQALHVFDVLFDARPPASALRWWRSDAEATKVPKQN